MLIVLPNCTFRQLPTEPLEANKIIAADCSSFDSFTLLFRQAELPYSYDSKIDKHDLNRINTDLIDKWILESNQDSTALVKWIRQVYNELKENDSWRVLFASHSFGWESHDYFIVNTWDQTSATNGGYFKHYLLKYNAHHQLVRIYDIGQTGINTNISVAFDEDQDLWQRKTDYLELSYTILNTGTIQCCSEARLEYEGDELEKHFNFADPNQIYDSIAEHLIIPGKVIKYSIDLTLP